ncbi:MAG: hypothetical protein QF845_02430 [Candidatus Marinimicrobia bacterium]|jgi:hypothetical protein|nr:hypothetical protein [Candidatus Neomarinimicrobiota bacterium]MDP6789371.1 hypothetical protein [Candidatus Neomarinimicrobiota bacterium]MDP7072739.1 hypothetical protein [Candidatus Neomarinimicrobiota bacterium]
MNKNLPTGIGRLLAHIQDLIDTGVKAVLRPGGDTGSKKKKKRFFNFFSEMGDSYYKTYEKEKRKK